MFQGYFIKVGDYILPMEVLSVEGYHAKPTTLDEDSYTDNFGRLHRTVLQKIPIVEATTLEISEEEASAIFRNIRSQFTNELENKAVVTAWIPFYGDYVTQDMYMSDPDITAKEVKKGKLYYKAVTFKFNGYGE